MTERLASIQTTVQIDAPQSHVWNVLTEPDYVRQWLGCMRYDNALGHVFYMQQDATKRANDDISGATHCKITALDKPHRFAFTWYLPGTPETLVVIELNTVGDGTTMAVLTHSGWEKFEPEAIRSIREMLEGGWKSAVLPNLKRVSEQE